MQVLEVVSLEPVEGQPPLEGSQRVVGQLAEVAVAVQVVGAA